MDKEEYALLIQDALKRNECIVLACYCTVRYSGRVESFLEFGDRVVLIKPDNVVIVHQPSGNAPVNYMRPDTDIHAFVKRHNLIIKTSNVKNKDFMSLEIEKVYFFNTHKLEDGQSITVQGTEKDMSDMLYDNPSMVETGFTPVSREEQTTYGFIDVFGTDKDGVLTIVECKRFRADLGAVTQLRRYVEKVKKSKGVDQVRGIIAAPKITGNALKMLEDWGFSFKQVTPPMYLQRFDRDQSRLDAFNNG
ncbi:DUF91 domain-containing protein [Candidatus Woesearchaeota archaeon]|nr:DUF91 domain-containing protein [Candidatus Woesearchaeota archaeon]